MVFALASVGEAYGDRQGISIGKHSGFETAKGVLVLGQAGRNFPRGDEIVLRGKSNGLARAFELIAELAEDFDLSSRDCDAPQRRKSL